jgi:hypothetical protein
MAMSLLGNTRFYVASAALAALAMVGSVLAAPASEPAMRATADEGDALEDDFSTVIVGTGSGGVWKSVNAGTTWTPIFDTYGAASIGEVRISQNNPDIIWVGTGEEDGRNSSTWGDGVYKSTDGGAIRLSRATTESP